MSSSIFSCREFKWLFTNFVTPSITFACMLLNTACFLVFTKSTLNTYSRSNMFKFLKAKSLLDVIESIIRLAKLFYTSNSLRNTLFASLLRIGVGDYLKSVVSLLSILTEIGADFNRLLEMRNSTSPLRRTKTFTLQLAILIAITSIAYTYSVFEKTVITDLNEWNETVYQAIPGDFGMLWFKKIFY